MSTRSIATYLFACSLVYAPFAHGCATHQAWFVLDFLLALAFLVYAVGCVQERSWSVSVVPVLAILFLVILGVAQALNPASIHDPVSLRVTHLQSYHPYLPGTLDQRCSVLALIHWGALALGFIALLDLMRSRDARWALQGTIAVTGVAMAIFGIYLKIQGGNLVPFTQTRTNTFFGTYVYHAHAAAFLSFCWPAALGLAIRSLHGIRPIGRALWINVFLLIFIALFINISKFGHLAALPGLGLGLLLLRKGIPAGGLRVAPLVLGVIALVLLGSVAAIVLPLVSSSLGRWDTVVKAGFGGRPVIYGVVLSMIRFYAPWGSGVGTFHLGFPYFTGHLGGSVVGRVSHAHEDYLQTMVEWGVLGSAAWFILVVGGFIKGWREHFRHPGELSTGIALVSLTIVGIHSTVDFPMQIGSLRYYAAVYLAMLWRVRTNSKDAPKKVT